MKNPKTNLSSGKNRKDFTPLAISMAILTGMFVAIQSYFFRKIS
jgi:hypothetical protein